MRAEWETGENTETGVRIQKTEFLGLSQDCLAAAPLRVF
jgi:hypothetical protein